MKRIYLIFAFAFVIIASAMAQKKITGTVVDENGEPVIGATIKIAGKGKAGAVTDINGNYSLDVPADTKVTISYIGYVSQTVKVGTKVKLKPDNSNLNEVVVVGYGALKQKNVTGSVEVIDMEDLRDLSVSSLSEALAGISPSVHVDLPATGRPGEQATITIRQAKSATALVPVGVDEGGRPIGGDNNPAPLFVIDDFISNEEEFNNLDIDEVESVTILKDGEAAIYGANGAYGVILVKTKRGKVGKPKISYQAQLTFTDAMRHADMLNGYDYGRIYNAGRWAKTGDATKDKIDLQKDFFQYDELEAMRDLNYNLIDKYWKSSLGQRHAINLNGGTEAATYYANVSYYTQDGNIGKLDYERWNYRAGVNANVGKYVKTSISVSGEYGDKNQHMTSSGGGSEQDYKYMLKNPTYVPDEIEGYPIYNSGMLNDPAFNNYYNYKSLYNSRNNKNNSTNNMTIQATANLDFSFWKPLKGLTAKFTYSKSISNSKNNNIRMENTVYRVRNRGGSGNHLYITDPTKIIDNDPLVDYDPISLEGFAYTSYENLEKRVLNDGQNSYISRDMSRGDSYQINFMLNYARKFGDHDVSGTFGIEKSESETEDVVASGTHPLSFTDGQSASLANDAVKDVSWSRNESGNLAYIVRANYAYKSKYLLQFIMRVQASNKFSPENYWKAFPGISAGWVMSEEPWFNKEKTKIDFLKFRGSFGIMGRDNVQAWRWKQLYDYCEEDGSIFGTNPNVVSARSFKLPEKSGTNPNLHWDTNYKTNFGIDLRAFDSRLSVTFDAYYDMGRDMFDYPSAHVLPGTTGIYAAPENFGRMDMWGGEIIAGWRQRFGRDLFITAKLGFGYDDNKVLETSWDANPTFTSKVKGERTDRGLWGLSCIGMFRSQQEIDEYFQHYNITSYLGLDKSKVKPGMLIYEDIRGPKDEDGNWTEPDGKIESNVDLVQISKFSSNPYNSTFNLNIAYKSFNLTATMQAQWGSYALVPTSLRGESWQDMETVNISQMWKDMFIYEDLMDEEGNLLVKANRDGSMPNIRYSSQNSQASTFWKMSGTKIELRYITLAYALPKKWVSTVGLSSVRFNITCQNALSLYNPIPNKVWNEFAGSYGSYPVVRKIVAGVNVTF
ncbi:MAG: TonB-dependent receptor [Prevotellaceae bacterium]|nr:TonB-dependent receptor [Prevotellaceae bacterium]